MYELTETNRDEIRREIANALGIDPNHIPALLTSEQTAVVLGVKPATLQNWRSLGRHRLRFVKVGRLPRYRVGDLVDWIAQRTAGSAS
ncbi:helix-turn-helix domain-containing protein [Acidithiobacillus sp. MC6.1]|nr:helix-turn-helix domain-containing protein [Acidithiobacillus sp. MC6.1]